MKKITAIILTITAILTMSFGAYAKTMLIGDVNGDGRITAADARLVLRIAAGLEPSLGEVEVKEIDPSTNKDTYHIGETWRVAGQWELTINSVEEIEERNPYSDKTPEAVYIVNYTYKNIGYVDSTSDGLYLSIDESIVDCNGKMGYYYAGDISRYPQEVPVGAYCETQACIGVDHAGNFTLTVTKYDGNDERRSAVFNIEVD